MLLTVSRGNKGGMGESVWVQKGARKGEGTIHPTILTLSKTAQRDLQLATFLYRTRRILFMMQKEV